MTNHRHLILDNILPLVPFDGWSDNALSQAAQQAGISREEAYRAFPVGVTGCIDYFFTCEDEALEAAFPANALAGQRVPERIETLVLARLERFALHKEATRRAIARRTLPWNLAHGAGSLYRTVDVMWRLAGDTSIDFSFYTKRATLAALYGSTLLFWLNDEAKTMENTKEFLKRGLGRIAAFGKRKMAIKSKLKMA